jgi:hypothetical protein
MTTWAQVHRQSAIEGSVPSFQRVSRREPVVAYFLAFRVFRTFGCFAERPFDAPAIRKSSNDLPPLMAATNQRGFSPRPAQVSVGFSGLRYLAATEALRPTLPPLPPPSNRASLASSDSSCRRLSVTFSAIAPSTYRANSCNLGMGIALRAMLSSSFSPDEASMIFDPVWHPVL